MRKILFITVMAVAALFSFASCDKEEEPANPNPYSVRFGYIRGTVNGTAFCLQNKEAPGETYITNGNIYTEYPKLGINSYGTNIPITKDQNEFVYGFVFHLVPIKAGAYDVISPNHEMFHNRVCFMDKRDTNNEKWYEPLKQPVKLLINRAEFVDSSNIPFIEGVINGVLYNQENLNDSIIVENVEFGVHY